MFVGIHRALQNLVDCRQTLGGRGLLTLGRTDDAHRLFLRFGGF